MVVTGDLQQGDRLECNGLADFLELIGRWGDSRLIDIVRFNLEDVERHEAVREVLKIYGEA